MLTSTCALLAVLVLQVPEAEKDRSTEADADPPTEHFLFSSFRGNGEDGLHLAHSTDGLSWTALRDNRPLLTPSIGGKLMRDPCICQGPDGTFHLVWTTGWFDRGIGIAHSKDLIHWSEQRWLPVMEHEPLARNCWAPEIFYDATAGDFLVCWSTTIPGRFPETEPFGDDIPNGKANHRIYSTTTKDFLAWTDTRLLYDDGFNVIDATIVKAGERYAMVVKDETLTPIAKKHLRVAFGESPKGPFGPASAPFTESWVEGASALQVGDLWYVYFDAYTRHRYEGAKTHDFVTWEPIGDALQFPEGTRHGTAFPVSGEIVAGLRGGE